MPEQSEYVFGETHISIMKIDDFLWQEHISILNRQEAERLQRFIPARRKKEFVATRFLKEQLFPNTTITYNEVGAPQLSSGDFISISHTVDYVGMAYCKTHSVGFDLELIREKVHRVKDKFLHKMEYHQLDTNNTEILIKIWSGKEALFKLMGKENIIFGENLLILPNQNKHWRGQVFIENAIFNVGMAIFTQGELVIAVNTEDVQKSK